MGYLSEEIFRARIVEEDAMWSERVHIRSLGDLLRWIGNRLKQDDEQVNNALGMKGECCV